MSHDQVAAPSRGITLLNENSMENPKRPAGFAPNPQTKRKRLNPEGRFDWGDLVLDLKMPGITDGLPLTELLDAIINSYFSHVHPWLPMLHELIFRQQVLEQVYRPNLEVILHAMVVAAARFIKRRDIPQSFNYISQLIEKSRDWVMLHALNSLSVENLQALLIIAFDDIGKGEAVKAWSIVGSLTRTVEYLQLSVEVEDNDEHLLLKPCHSLPLSQDWTEMETRRRVFWNIFNPDRFCSVVMGWNTSLTSDDVHRRLPVDGVLWRKQEPVLAPFFGIWDKSAGRIGNSITFLPTGYPPLTHSGDEDYQSPAVNMGFGQDTNSDGISALGAFAYCIEAIESMSRVTTYFLQQKVDLDDKKQIGSWLTRFKELDLRLVHWKMFLPQKWKDTNISRQANEVIMDPNLTLAHITHNASMILLHQLIAYPPADWHWATRLPSRCSADTCQTAGLETSSITENYLRSPTKSKIVNCQFTFCLFIAARVLLGNTVPYPLFMETRSPPFHWRYYEDPSPLPAFFKLIASLDTLSNRWGCTTKVHAKSQQNLAAQYARLLRRMHERCLSDSKYRIDVLAYANELGSSSIELPGAATMVRASAGSEEEANILKSNKGRTSNKQSHMQIQETQDIAERGEQISCEWRPSSSAREILVPPDANTTPAHLPIDEGQYILPHPTDIPGDGVITDDLTSISQMSFDQQFLDRDRVISYDDGMFTANMDWWGQNS
ncbi:hypothetical protein BP5796_09337 [Coleophoma crateriformis]|uniref:Xylanolytic transcriptional activator regulatory domain-containing protein n=1 Tax=Coleophoma crateriformis TaxID=565419 RepID=A0A3D8R3Y9_9HELO|nr:hypothetical protein BP5796_09337 [Coleophoma crateriformis]